jgi:hypothetical protein
MISIQVVTSDDGTPGGETCAEENQMYTWIYYCYPQGPATCLFPILDAMFWTTKTVRSEA